MCIRDSHMVLLSSGDGILIGFPVIEINTGILLDGLHHGQALPVAQVDLLALVGDLHAAADLESQAFVELFHQIHHAMEISECLIQLNGGEFGVMLGVHRCV